MQLAKKDKGAKTRGCFKISKRYQQKITNFDKCKSELLENKSKIKLAKQEKGQNNKGCYKLSKRYQERSQTLVNVTFEFLENKSLI